MSKIDRRKYDVGDNINIFLKSGEAVKGKVYAVQYEEPEGLDRSPAQRHSFRYIIEIGRRESGEDLQFDEKSGKMKKVKVYEPVYQTVHESQLKD